MTTPLEWRRHGEWRTAYSPETDTRYSIDLNLYDDGGTFWSLLVLAEGRDALEFFDTVEDAMAAADRMHAGRMAAK